MPQEPAKTPQRRCPECAKLFPLTDLRRRYCTPEHKRAWENRQTGRGQGPVFMAMAWRQGRHRKGSEAAKWAFSEFCIALDRMSAEDKASGRMSALDILTDRMRADGILDA